MRLDSGLARWHKVWDLSMDVNLTSPAIWCREAVVAFGRSGGGIIDLVSQAAFRGDDAGYWHYAAAKAGMVAMTRTIARQYGRQGITAFAIAPGYVATPFNHVFDETVGVEVA